MDARPAASADGEPARTRVLLIAVFTIATCGLVYELLSGTIASYLLGDSVTQFSTVIGVYLFSMGVGSYLSRYFQKELIARFIEIEILVGLVGGLSSPVLFLAFSEIGAFRVVLYGWVTATGVLVGLEIPFLIRILKDQFPLHDLVSRVLSLDYLGALAASLLFPLWLVPQVGLMRSSFVFGGLNVLVAVWTCHVFREQHRRPRLTAQAYAALGVLTLGAVFSDDLVDWSERRLYDDSVVLSRSSPYQRIVLTRGEGGVRLFLDGNLQFASLDEYRYHEALVHPGLASVAAPRRAPGPRRRRRHGGPRDSQGRSRAGDHPGRSGPADDGNLPRSRGPSPPSTTTRCDRRGSGWSTPTRSSGSNPIRPATTSSWSISPTRVPTRSASSTRPPSTGGSASG